MVVGRNLWICAIHGLRRSTDCAKHGHCLCHSWHNISSVTEMVGHLGWEPLATRRRNMRLCMMYKIAHTAVGDPWAEWLTTTKRVTRGFHAWKYIPIYSQHNIYKFSFLPRTIIDWNILSPHSVDSPSIDTFRARITKN